MADVGAECAREPSVNGTRARRRADKGPDTIAQESVCSIEAEHRKKQMAATAAGGEKKTRNADVMTLLSPDLDHFKVQMLLRTLSYDPAVHRAVEAMANLTQLLEATEKGEVPQTFRAKLTTDLPAQTTPDPAADRRLLHKIPWALYETHGIAQILRFFNSTSTVYRLLSMDMLKFIVCVDGLRAIVLKREPQLIAKLLVLVSHDYCVRFGALSVLLVLSGYASMHEQMHRHGMVQHLAAVLQPPSFYAAADPRVFDLLRTGYLNSFLDAHFQDGTTQDALQLIVACDKMSLQLIYSLALHPDPRMGGQVCAMVNWIQGFWMSAAAALCADDEKIPRKVKPTDEKVAAFAALLTGVLQSPESQDLIHWVIAIWKWCLRFDEATRKELQKNCMFAQAFKLVQDTATHPAMIYGLQALQVAIFDETWTHDDIPGYGLFLAPATLRYCSFMDCSSDAAPPFQACPLCHVAVYCSATCREAHSPDHLTFCRIWRALAA